MAMTEEQKERKRERDRKYRANNLDKVRERERKYRANNLDKERERARTWRATVEGEKRFRERQWRVQGIIGTTMERFNSMCDERGHVCEICREGNTRAGKPRSLEVDHDHKTGEVRGLLCTACNHRLGQIEKHTVSGPHKCGVKFTERAIAYMLTVTLRRLNKQSTN